jgi:hypothetical protein
MTYQIPQNWPDFDPAPNVATLAEIQFAEELRHRLEMKFLGWTDTRPRRFGAFEYEA